MITNPANHWGHWTYKKKSVGKGVKNLHIRCFSKIKSRMTDMSEDSIQGFPSILLQYTLVETHLHCLSAFFGGHPFHFYDCVQLYILKHVGYHQIYCIYIYIYTWEFNKPMIWVGGITETPLKKHTITTPMACQGPCIEPQSGGCGTMGRMVEKWLENSFIVIPKKIGRLTSLNSGQTNWVFFFWHFFASVSISYEHTDTK